MDAWLNAMQSSMYMGYLIALAKQLEDSAVAGEAPVMTSMAGIRRKSNFKVGGLLVDHFGMVSTDALYIRDLEVQWKDLQKRLEKHVCAVEAILHPESTKRL